MRRAVLALDTLGGAEGWRDSHQREIVWIHLPREYAPSWCAAMRGHDVPLLGERLFEYHRMLSGMPRVGREVTDKDLILEANLELAISRNKGCYPGQEVVERIFTYGQVNRKLLPVAISVSSGSQLKGELPAAPFALVRDGKSAGKVVSLDQDPGDSGHGAGLAYIHRLYWTETQPLVSEDGRASVVIRGQGR
jgi:folate-binding protein YgfZ